MSNDFPMSVEHLLNILEFITPFKVSEEFSFFTLVTDIHRNCNCNCIECNLPMIIDYFIKYPSLLAKINLAKLVRRLIALFDYHRI